MPDALRVECLPNTWGDIRGGTEVVLRTSELADMVRSVLRRVLLNSCSNGRKVT